MGGGHLCRLPPKAIELRSMTGSKTRSHTNGAGLRPGWTAEEAVATWIMGETDEGITSNEGTL
jgi:hypothetical protein